MITDALTGITVPGTPLSLVQAAGTYNASNVIDLGANARDVGLGEAFDLSIEIVAAVLSAGAATVQFQVTTSDDAAQSTNVQVIAQTDAIPKANLTAGANFALRVGPVAGEYPARRYLGVRFVVGTATTTQGTANLNFVKNAVYPQVNYPSGFSVL